MGDTKTDEGDKSLEEFAALLDKVRAAQAEFATFSQEKVDEIFHAAAMAASKERIRLAQMAVDETGMGLMEDKAIKNLYASEYIYNAYKDTKTVGVVEEDKAAGVKKIAEPMGVVGAVIPTTNPTSTAIFKSLICIKTRNAIIISPHPSAGKCTIEAARVVRDAAEAAGLPKNIINWVDKPTLEITNMLMRESDIILATGGPGMVHAAYSSGKPALGVGPGNNPAIIDSSADVVMSVNSIIHSKTFDNGMICASENTVILLDDIYDEAVAEFKKRGCVFLTGKDADAVGHTIITETGKVNPKIVGHAAYKIAEIAGVSVPKSTKILMAATESVDPSNPWSREKLSPALGVYRAKDFDDAMAKAQRLVRDGGYGHTASLFIDTAETEKLDKYENAMNTCRILINTPASQGGIGDIYNALTPSLTLGCGSWGGNSISENVGVKNLINIKSVAERRDNMLWVRIPEKIYFKRGCMTTAIEELGTELHKKRAFIISGRYTYNHGDTRPIEAKLDELGIVHTNFWNIQPDPTLGNVEEGLKQIQAFQPDVIIAMGGGSAMDAAKIMWLMYENPDQKFEDLSADFMDIRKRIHKFPELGKKAYFVAVPTSSGTGSEITPFAIITDEKNGVKWPIADYALVPNMAIVDTNNMMTQPKGLTSASGVDVLTHCLEAYASIMHSDFTDAAALKGMKLVFDYLPRAYDNPDDVEARDHMANASTLAGIAFGNAFLGVNHSMAHKLGAYHHIAHGWANAVILTRVMRYNAAEKPTRMGTFPGYDHPDALARYAEAARFCGVQGKDDKEVFENFLAKIDALCEYVGVKKTIAEFGVDEKYFLDTLDEMSLNAFNDQCTGANPRYPLVSEIKELYLDAYYGRPASSYEE